jgi:hypothetical protein
VLPSGLVVGGSVCGVVAARGACVRRESASFARSSASVERRVVMAAA